MNPTKIFNIFKMLGVSIFILLVFLFFSLPNVRQIEKVTNHSSILVNIKNDKITVIEAKNSIPIKYKELPQKLIQAVITQEDRGFYSHLGFSIKGTIKGVLNLVLGKSGGGSGITQQLAKNLFFYIGRAPKKITIQRKIYEILLALKIEMNFSKNEILTMYFNAISFGRQHNGIESASRGYFNKYTSELNTYESTLLVQSIPLPARFNVKRNKKKAFIRANKLLIKMKEQGYILQSEINKARKISIKKETRVLRRRTHRFLFDYVKKDILKICKGKNGDFTIVLTLEPVKQLYAQLALERRMKIIKGKELQSALLSLSPNGAIRAMVGSTNYSESQFNRTISAKRQPASTFKPIIYLAALENGWKPNSIISDDKITIGKFSPRNYDRKYLGDISLTDALKKSRNTASVRLLTKLDYKDVDSLVKRLGISEKLPHNAMLALGYKEISMLEMTSAYTVFSNGGKEVKPYGIELIRDRLGEVIYEHVEEKREQVVELKYISDINKMLKEVIKSGTGQKAGGFIAEIAGKTGTGQKNKDAWFIGYSAYLTTAVWIGHDDNKPMKNITGGGHAALGWKNFMTNSHQGLKRKNLP
jgi:penicillin-binding protein 1A